MTIDKRTECVICGKTISYRFGRPRKACSNPHCQEALQRLRARRFKLKKKKIKGAAIYQLKQVQIDFYEPVFTNTDLGNPLNIGSKMEIIPYYSNLEFEGFRSLNPLTIEFVDDSTLFLHHHPQLVTYPQFIRGKEKVHRVGPGELFLICNDCQSSKLLWSETGWYCSECGNEKDFSLPIY